MGWRRTGSGSAGRPPRPRMAGGTTAHYTVEQCLKDWLESLNTQAESTVTGYRIMARHLTGLIGKVKLADLKVRDVQFALGKLAERLSTRSVRLARMILIQATRNAMVNDLVVRNVADLTAVPAGMPGRPSRSLNLEQALAVLDAAQAPAPAGYAYRGHRAGPAVREQREDQRRPKLTVRLPRSLLPRKLGL